MTQNDRIRHLNSLTIKDGDFVLYWMQACQRAVYNNALEFAITEANKLKKPLVVFFGLTDNYCNANLRHYQFMFEGLLEVKHQLNNRGIKFVIQYCQNIAESLAKFSNDACLVITDMGYLINQRQWRQQAAKLLKCCLIQIETEVVVPINKVSDKREYAARTIRPKILKHINQFLVPLKTQDIVKDSVKKDFDSIEIDNIDKILSELQIDKTILPSSQYQGGYRQAKKLLNNFIEHKLKNYDKDRNDPSIDGLSNMSPYLHFGQISPIEIALKVRKAGGNAADVYLEEMIIRRELSMNFVYYTQNYDSYDCLPGWAKATLEKHKKDNRDYIYLQSQLENSQTHDEAWNAAQTQMTITGKMHGYMRMYWGKKIIEWSKTPQKAFQTMIYLNDKYELDGRDPNGYCGIAWCFGNHDRPWGERKIFGTVRYMNIQGLKRKFDVEKYIQNIDNIK